MALRHTTVRWIVLLSLWLPSCGTATPVPRAGPGADTTDSTELFRRGQAAAKQGDSVRAEQYLSMALERGFDDKKVLPIMLEVCLSSNRLRAALNHAERYLRDHPEDQNLRYLVATIQLGLGQTEQAQIALNHLLRTNPKNANAHYLLGVLESAGSGSTRANQHFLEYLQLAPNGEHAAEVRSRLTDLDVRANLDAPVTVHDASGLVDRGFKKPVPALPQDTPASANSVWFTADTDVKEANSSFGAQQ